MKLNKILFYISLIIGTLTLGLSTFLKFYFQYSNNIDYIISILLNIFSGSIILLVTSLVDYLINRKKCLMNITLLCEEFADEFEKFGYFVELKLKLSKDEKSDKEYIKEYSKNTFSLNKTRLKNVLEQYIILSKTNMNKVWSIYDDLDFILDFNNKRKKQIYNNVFKYIDEKIYLIKKNIYYFELFTECGDYDIAKEKLVILQDKIFEAIESDNFDRNGMCPEWENIADKLHSHYSIFIGLNYDSNLMAYNEVSENLWKMYNYISNIRHYKKNILQ